MTLVHSSLLLLLLLLLGPLLYFFSFLFLIAAGREDLRREERERMSATYQRSEEGVEKISGGDSCQRECMHSPHHHLWSSKIRNLFLAVAENSLRLNPDMLGKAYTG